MIERDLTPRLLKAASEFPAVTLTGPRQSGKSTLCRQVFADLPYANLEAPDTRSFAQSDPRAFLAQFPDGAVLDEVQRVPELPSYLQGLIDDDPRPGRWILTGSQNLTLVDSVSQSLAGRSAVLHLLPLAWSEVLRFENRPATLEEAVFTGGYPAILDRGIVPSDWLGAYVGTYVERDVRTISNIGDLVAFQRFVELCAGRTSQLVNHSALAADTGITQPTAKAWLTVLETSFLAFRLTAFHGNLRKRLVKMPKLHFHDTGLVCWLLGIRSPDQLRSHPLRGPIFETWVVSEVLKHRMNRGESTGLSFYRDRNGAEVDLIVERSDGLTLVEAKASQTAASSLFSSVQRVRGHLDDPARPCDVVVVYGGDEAQRRSEGELLPWNQLHERDWGR
jgi:hypothetical protein